MTAALRAVLPRDWRPFSAPGVVVIARPPDDARGYRTNLLIAREHLPGSVRLDDAAARVLDRTGASPVDLEVLGAVDGIAPAGDVERCARLVRFELGPGHVELVQLRALVARPIDGMPRDVVVFAATCLFDELDRYGRDFVSVLASIRPSFGPPTSR